LVVNFIQNIIRFAHFYFLRKMRPSLYQLNIGTAIR
jgi:hypothetical protein